MSAASRQTPRVLDGSYVLDRPADVTEVSSRAGVPAGRSELPDEVVQFVARQVKVSASELGFYEWSGRTAEYHRNRVREHLGFRGSRMIPNT